MKSEEILVDNQMTNLPDRIELKNNSGTKI